MIYGFSDTKFRRETSKFKINYTVDTYIPDPNSKNPTEPIQGLLQILPKNLGPEDFIGAILEKNSDGHRNITAFIRILQNDPNVIELDNTLRYIPSTGYFVDDSYDFANDEGSESGGGNL